MSVAGPEPELRADYGIEALPAIYLTLAAGLVAMAVAVVFRIDWLVYASALPLLVAVFLVASARIGKLIEREHIVDLADITPESQLLDVGTGSGLLGIAAAKRLRSGKVYGVDTWQAQDLSENGQPPAARNAIAEGVAGRFLVEEAELIRLPFPAQMFDAVVSGFALHRLPSVEERQLAIKEMARVLKRGGHLIIIDSVFVTGQYVPMLQDAGLYNVQRSIYRPTIFPPTQIVSAQK